MTATTSSTSQPPLACDQKHVRGSFDFIGDIHGCADELLELLVLLGHAATPSIEGLQPHPEGRRVILLGDLADRGPKNLESIRIAMRLVRSYNAFCILGNHDDKLRRWMRGNKVTINNGLADTIAELEGIDAAEFKEIHHFLESLQSHYVFDNGAIVAAHAGLEERLHGLETREARNAGLYGMVGEGETEEGFPNRLDWAEAYQGAATVVQGHDLQETPAFKNRVHAIDTGCVFGGQLTALRWPEETYNAVLARKQYVQHKTFLATK